MKVLLLDGTGLAYRSYYAFVRNPLRNSRGEETSLTFAFVNTVLKALERHAPGRAAIVFDAPGKTFRHDLDATYKAGRPPMPDAMAAQLVRLYETLDAFRLPRLQVPGVEADDVLGTLARRFERAGAKVYLVTGDKDFQQLLSDSIRMLRWRRAGTELEEIGPAELRAQLGLEAAQIVDYLALTGDAVDNVPGVRGIGEKTARKLLLDHGSLEAIYAEIERLTPLSLRQKLEAGRESAEHSRQLLRIVTDVPLDVGEDDLQWQTPDWPRLQQILRQLEFWQLLQKLPAPQAPASPAKVEAVESDAQLAALAERLQSAEQLAVAAQTAPDPTGRESIHALALAPSADHSFVLHFASAQSQPLLGGLGLETPRGEGWDLGTVRMVLGDCMRRPGLKLLGHDLKLLSTLLHAEGFVLGEPWFDTMIASYVLDPSRPAPDLEAIIAQQLESQLPRPAAARGGDVRRMPRAESLAWVGGLAAALHPLSARLETELRDARMYELFDEVEMPLLRVLFDMEQAGVKVDVTELGKLSHELEERSAVLATAIYALAGRPFNLQSPRQLGEILFTELGLPHGRRTQKGWSTDGDVLERLALEHELPRQVLEYRQLAKLRSTYTEALPRLVRAQSGRIHTCFHQAVASTGRLSSSDPNLQNIPIKSDIGRRIRAAFVAEAPEARLLSADYSQIELRIMAHLSQDRALLQAFRSGGDVHTLTAARIASSAPEAVTPAQRAAAKTVNFGVLYGMGARGLAQQLGISIEEARRFIDEYFASYPGVRAYTQDMVQQARKQGFVTTLLGRKLHLPDLTSTHPGQRAFAERVAVNAPIQGSAADLIKIAMVRVHRTLQSERLQARMILQVHDELLFELPESEVERVAALARHEMEHALRLSVPLMVEIGTGRHWAEAH